MSLRTFALGTCLLAGACYRGPDKRDDEVARRLTVLEQRLDAQQHALDELRAKGTGDDDVVIGAIAKQLGDLEAQVAALGARPKGPPAAPRFHEPDRAAVYAVPLGNSPTYGSPKAKVTLVMVGEFACPYCRKAFDTVDELRKKYGKDLRVSYKSFIVHPQRATLAAEAACAANRQGKWRELAELIWAKGFDALASDPHALEQPNLDSLAQQAGLDLTRYQADLTGPCPAEVRDEGAAMTRLGVGATPSFFINGRFLAGALPLESFSALIDEELDKATAATKKGVKSEKYYEQEIVGKGLKEPAP